MKGKDTVVRNLLAAVQKLKGAAAAALYQEGLAIDANAVKRTPVDTGRLRASHYVSPPTASGGDMVVEVGFGTEYAVFVHERTDLAHKVGEAKFLQNAMNERSAGFLERIAKRTRANQRAGVTSAVLDPNVPARPSADAIDAAHAAYRERRSRVAAKRKERRAKRRAERKFFRNERHLERRAKKKAKKQAQALARQDKRAQAKARKKRIADAKAAFGKQSRKFRRKRKKR